MPIGSKEIIIKSKRSWFELGFGEIFSFRDLFILLIRRDFVTSYKQTILGPFWIVIQALAGSAVCLFGNFWKYCRNSNRWHQLSYSIFAVTWHGNILHKSLAWDLTHFNQILVYFLKFIFHA